MTTFSKKSDLSMTNIVWITTLSVLQIERTTNLEVKNTFSLIYAMECDHNMVDFVLMM